MEPLNGWPAPQKKSHSNGWTPICAAVGRATRMTGFEDEESVAPERPRAGIPLKPWTTSSVVMRSS